MEDPARGRVRITDLGRSVLAESPSAIDDQFLLDRFASFREWKSGFKSKSVGDKEPLTAEEPKGTFKQIEEAHQSLAEAAATLSEATATEVLDRLKTCSPAFFERVVVDLLIAMGYGGLGGDGVVTGRGGRRGN